VTGKYSRQRISRPFSGNKCQQCVESNAGKRAGLSAACMSLTLIMRSGVARNFSQGVRNSNSLQSSTVVLHCFWTIAIIV